MTIAETIFPEFDIEMAGTRKTLERLPEKMLDWRAHEKAVWFKFRVTRVFRRSS
jgi:hypothetical protein